MMLAMSRQEVVFKGVIVNKCARKGAKMQRKRGKI